MTNKLDSAAIAAQFAALERADRRNATARLACFDALHSLGLPDSGIPSGKPGAELRVAVQDAILLAWQSAAFLRWYRSDKSTGQSRAGTVRNEDGSEAKVTLSRTDWARRLSSKVSKFDTAYQKHRAAVVAAKDHAEAVAKAVELGEEAPEAAPKGAGKSPAAPGAKLREVIASCRKRIATASERDTDASLAVLASYADADVRKDVAAFLAELDTLATSMKGKKKA